jgi:hypothetical protein
MLLADTRIGVATVTGAPITISSLAVVVSVAPISHPPPLTPIAVPAKLHFLNVRDLLGPCSRQRDGKCGGYGCQADCHSKRSCGQRICKVFIKDSFSMEG